MKHCYICSLRVVKTRGEDLLSWRQEASTAHASNYDKIWGPSLGFSHEYSVRPNTEFSLSQYPFLFLFRFALEEILRFLQLNDTTVGDLTIITGVGKGSLHALQPVVS